MKNGGSPIQSYGCIQKICLFFIFLLCLISFISVIWETEYAQYVAYISDLTSSYNFSYLQKQFMENGFGLPLQLSNENSKPPLIVAWTSFFSMSLVDFLQANCSAKCTFISRKQFESSNSTQVPDAYLFHARNLNPGDLPERRHHQLFVYMLMESPNHMGGQTAKMPRDYFNATMTYRMDSDYQKAYGSFEPRTIDYNQTEYNTKLMDLIKNKTKGVLAFISNCQTASRRENYIQELSRYINMTIFGCKNIRTSDKPCKGGSQCEKDVIANHRFYLSFENSVCTDYITEKFFLRMSQMLVPIVMKKKIYQIPIVPKGSFIASDDFTSPKELARHLNNLQMNDKAYAAYFDWTKHFKTKLVNPTPICKLCEDLYSKPQRSVKDIVKYYSENVCDNYVS